MPVSRRRVCPTQEESASVGASGISRCILAARWAWVLGPPIVYDSTFSHILEVLIDSKAFWPREEKHVGYRGRVMAREKFLHLIHD